MNTLPLKAIPIPIQGEIEAQKKPKPRKILSRQSRHFLGVLAAMAVVMYGMDRIIQVKSIDVSNADGKLDYVFITPTVDRLMLSNKRNKLIQNNREHAEFVVRVCVTEAFNKQIPHGVQLCLNMLNIESRFNPTALNYDSGATGASQHMPMSHTKRLMQEGIIKTHWLELHDMETAIKAWASTLSLYIKETGSIEGAVIKYGGWWNRPDDPGAEVYLRGAMGT